METVQMSSTDLGGTAHSTQKKKEKKTPVVLNEKHGSLQSSIS